jgi:large subunit ribosomal protein L21
MKLAVIETGGKQYLVSEGQKVKIEKIDGKIGDKIKFDQVLLVVDGDKVSVGNPIIKSASVGAEIKRIGRSRKVIVFRYHSKTRRRKKKGHRQNFVEVEITKI